MGAAVWAMSEATTRMIPERKVEAAQVSTPVGDADEDLALARAAARGEMRAFNVLVRRYQGRVFGMAVRMLGDAAEAEDVAQEVFVALHGALSTFRGDSRVATWIFRITRNHCLNRLKFLSRRGRRSMGPQAHDDGQDPLDNVRSPVPGPLQVTEAAEEGRMIETALGQLTAEHRELMLLREVEQLSYEELGEITGLPEGTLKSRLHRARAALMSHLPPALLERLGRGAG